MIRIHLGTEAQRHVNLSRFDWGGPRVISRFDYGGPRIIEDNQLGHWRVKTEEGLYTISLDLPEITKSGIAHLKYKEVHLRQPIQANQEKVVFSNVRLPAGSGNFHAYLKIDRLATGPLFVDVIRLD